MNNKMKTKKDLDWVNSKGVKYVALQGDDYNQDNDNNHSGFIGDFSEDSFRAKYPVKKSADVHRANNSASKTKKYLRIKNEEKQALIKDIKMLAAKINTLEGRAENAEKIVLEADQEVQHAQSKIIDSLASAEYSYESLDQDTFTLMVTSRPLTNTWWFGMMVYVSQIILLTFIFISITPKNTTPFGVPFDVTGSVRATQVLSIVLIVSIANDVFMPLKEISMLWITNPDKWKNVMSCNTVDDTFLPDWKHWMIRIVFPNFLKFTEGVLVLILSFVLIIRSEFVIDIIMDLTMMHLISEFDNLAFMLAIHGYIGSGLKNDAIKAKQIKVEDKIPKVFGFPLRPLLLGALLAIMLTSFLGFVVGQRNGHYFYLEYSHCEIPRTEIVKIGDQQCDGGVLNSIDCGFEGGDCIDFNLGYPRCDVLHPYTVGDGTCNQENNKPSCLFDGGDCCAIAKNETFLLGDSICNGGFYNTMACKFDNGDCDEFRSEYEKCPDYPLDSAYIPPFKIGDGVCDFVAHYMTEDCGHEGGDCKECIVDKPELLGNGICDGGQYNTVGCNYDNGDCAECNNSVEDLTKIGNGFCDGGQYMQDVCDDDGGDCNGCNVGNFSFVGDGFCNGGAYMSDFCDNDGGDCDGCKVEDRSLVGDGICSGPMYMTDACSNDGGDCDGCEVENKTKLGDGFCDGGLYNSKECGYDAGDCIKCNKIIFADNEKNLGDGVCNFGFLGVNMDPACNYDGGDCAGCEVENPSWLGNGQCNGGEYDTLECKFDGGDCLHEHYPECNVINKMFIANRNCDGPRYNTEACGWDGGDCDSFNKKYPKCDRSKVIPGKVGDGNCDGTPYNVEGCDYDGGDCVLRNKNMIETYPNCTSDIEDIRYVGDGLCHQEFNKDECGWDNGDCLEFNETYPKCRNVNNPWKIGNGECNHGFYNTEACGWDGGDCDERNAELRNTYPNCTFLNHFVNPWIGDGICHNHMNIPECGFDWGDCEDENEELRNKYPNCKYLNHRYRPFVGDGDCDSLLNSPDCGFDVGDCTEKNAVFKSNFPNCTDHGKYYGDDYCDVTLNTEDCGWDDGDCDEKTAYLKTNYPDCAAGNITMVQHSKWLGDGVCCVIFDSSECGWDDGDCSGFKEKYPNCKVDVDGYVGNGKCDHNGNYNTKECEWDGGDCDERNAELRNKYPKCPYLDEYTRFVGDSYCQSAINTTDCGYDDGDCL